jgi:hypothetical protein
VDAEGRRNTGRQVRGIVVGEGVTTDGHILFLFLKNIGGTEGGVGERRANRRAGSGTGTKSGLLTGGQWGLDDLCLDDTQNLPNLTTNGSDNHGNLVEEITSITCVSQVRVPWIRFGGIGSWGVGTQIRARDGEVFEAEVGTTFRTARRWESVGNGWGGIDRRDQSDLNDVWSMGARCLDGLGIVEGIVNDGCDLWRSGGTNCLTHDDVRVIRTVSERRSSTSGVVVAGSNGGVWLLVWIWAVEDIFGTGGNILGWWNWGSSLLFCLFQKATAIPPYEDTDSKHEEEDSDDSARESALVYTTGGAGLLRVGYALKRFTLCASPIRTLDRRGRERERERDGMYLRVRTQLSFAPQLQGGGAWQTICGSGQALANRRWSMWVRVGEIKGKEREGFKRQVELLSTSEPNRWDEKGNAMKTVTPQLWQPRDIVAILKPCPWSLLKI